MPANKVLVVTTVVPDAARLREQLRGLIADEADVRIVAPAAKLSWLEWLANEEDDARREAVEAAERTAESLPDDVSVAIDRTSQDSNVVQAMRDVLRAFPAEELVIVTRPGEDASWLEENAVRASLEGVGLPVRHVELPDEHD